MILDVDLAIWGNRPAAEECQRWRQYRHSYQRTPTAYDDSGPCNRCYRPLYHVIHTLEEVS